MATYVLGSVGTAFGGPIGGMIGSGIGGYIDQMLIGMLTPGTSTTNSSPRLTEISLTRSTEGAPIPKVYGRARFGGQVIWAAQFKETEKSETQTSGGKGGGPKTEVTTISYSYSLSFAVAFCEGNHLAHLGRVWIDSVETDLSKYNFRFYRGSESQGPDPTMEAIEGIGNVPSYRGISYIVFEDLPLGDYGNRLPQITAEVIIPLDTENPNDLSNIGRAWQLIPATGEHSYGMQKYTRSSTENQEEVKVIENMHNNFNEPNAKVALDILETVQPNLKAVSVVVSWFGTDLRANQCRIIPKIEGRDRQVSPTDWVVAGYNRANAEIVSYDNKNNPIFGGTPSDVTVREIVQHIKNMGKRVVFYPFILMDIPENNTLPNPYSNNTSGIGQPVFPWRGRITCSPAPGFTGTVDKTATAATQINNWFTKAEGYRNMVLHYANLLDDLLGAGDAFIIGSELIGITQVRSSAGAGVYPGVNQLITLASDIRAILNASVKIGYAADWSEYHSHRPNDGSNDVIFNMDPLWASSNIDFIGIDNYLPMSDWREGSNHLDFDSVNGPVSIYNREYLKSNIEGGEYYDWYYTSEANRKSQSRTRIIDGNPANEPWIFRQKDIRNWWSNSHRNRPGGVRSSTPTSFIPSTKPVWFTEFGCPAVDKGTNQPNVFYDPKSSESFFPYFSRGTRDDTIQRLYIESFLQYWADFGGSMVNIDNCFIWTWDARPFPAYPMRTDIWADGNQWVLGHWLSGRIDGVMLHRLVYEICKQSGLKDSQIDVEGLIGPECLIRGFIVDKQTSARDILQSLAEAYEFKGLESQGKLKFVMDLNQTTTELPLDDLVFTDEKATAPVTITRGQETEIPNKVNVSFMDELNSYQPASISAQKGTGSSNNQTSVDFPLVWTNNHAKTLANSLLFKAWSAREKGDFTLPPSYIRMDVGDLVYVPVGSRAIGAQIQAITDSLSRSVEFSSFDLSVLSSPEYETDIRLPEISAIVAKTFLKFMNLPLLTGDEAKPYSMRLAAGAPDGGWPGGLNLLKSDGSNGFTDLQIIPSRTPMATLTSPLYSGPTQRWDRYGEIYLTMLSGGLSSISEEALLTGIKNALAIHNSVTNEWEVIQFAQAQLTGVGSYKLKNLIRGQLGTEHVIRNPYPAGTWVVFLSPYSIVPLEVTKNTVIADTLYRWGSIGVSSVEDVYVQGSRKGTLAGLRPYSPCDFSLVRDSSNDSLILDWKRRTRIGGDNWEANEVPLSEEKEQYKLEIYNFAGTILKRSLILSDTSFVYPASMQITDYGSTQTSIYAKVYQYGAEYGGYGPPLSGIFYIKGSK